MNIKRFINEHRTLIAFFLIFSIFTSILIVKVFTTSINYDDAYNISIAKNIAGGYGYVSSYNAFIYFNSEVTTGPTMILPAALLIKIFGNQLWIPQLVPVVILISGILMALGLNLLKNKRQNLLIFTLFILLLVILIPSSNFFTFLGELPSAILVIISAILLTRLKSKYLFIGGITFALAVLTKTIVILFLPSAILSLCLYYSINRGINKSIISLIKLSFAFLLGFILIYGSYSFVKSKFIPNLELEKNTLTEGEFFLSASGLKNIIESKGMREKLEYVEKNFSNSFNNLSNHFQSKVITALFLISIITILVALIARSITKRKFSKYYIAIFALGINILLHFIWWFTISHDGWVRHLCQIFVYIAFLVAIYIIKNFSTYKVVLPVLIIVALISLFRFSSIKEFFSFTTDVRSIPLIQTTEFLTQFKDKNPSVVFAGCGWWANRDLEYTMSTILNFKNCYYMDQEYLDNHEVYLVRSDIYNWGNEEFINKFTDLCEQEVVYVNHMFKVSRCYKRPL